MLSVKTIHQNASHPPRRRAIMPKAKIIRLELPKAKLLKFNRNGKSIPTTAPQRDELAERLSFLREGLSDEQWARMRPICAEAFEEPNPDLEKLGALVAEYNRWAAGGGTAS
jgi:hypothetical protein